MSCDSCLCAALSNEHPPLLPHNRFLHAIQVDNVDVRLAQYLVPTREASQLCKKLESFEEVYGTYTMRRLDRTLRVQVSDSVDSPGRSVRPAPKEESGKEAVWEPGAEAVVGTAEERCAAIDGFLSAQATVEDRCDALDSFLNAQAASATSTLSNKRKSVLDALLDQLAE